MKQADHILYLGLGGNIGDSHKIFDKAIIALQENMEIQAKSSRMMSAAMYQTNQPDFLNMTLKARTSLSADGVLTVLKQIEADLGRDMDAVRYSERPLDIDLLYYDDAIIHSENLIVPHPLLHERRFVLQPLSEITPPDFRDPRFGKNVSEMLHDLASISAEANEDASLDDLRIRAV